MENNIKSFFDLLLNYLADFIGLYKEKMLLILDPVISYITPYEDIALWASPFAAFLLLLLLCSGLKKILCKKSIKEKPLEEEDSEVLYEPVIAEKEEIQKTSQPKEKDEPVKDKTVEPYKPPGILKNIRTGLSKTRKAFSSGVDRIFTGGSFDEDMLEELEELLITSDVGVKTSMEIIEKLTEKKSEIKSPDDLKRLLKEEIFSYINVAEKELSASKYSKPHVIMVVGVNGVGKTTTIGKLSSKFVKEGKKVLIVAADTFRAAASDQLQVWAERSGADIVRHRDNSDPSSVAFDGMDAAMAREVDIVIIDTAGRLHTKKNLMEELKKIERTVSAKIPDAPHETLMVVDATTGQNALQQAKLFNEAIGITTIALTKLDGTAKGGIVAGITNTLNIPLKYVGVGEQVDDLQIFDPKEFVDALI